MAQIDNLTLEIQADSTKAVTALNNLSTAMSNLKTNLPTKAKLENSAKGFKTLTEQISKLSLSARSLNQIKALGSIANSLSKLSSVKPTQIKKTADNLNSLQGAISNISYQGVDKIERLASAFSKLAQSNKGMGSIANIRKVANASAQAQPLVSETTTVTGTSNVSTMSSVSNAISLFSVLKEVGTTLQPILKGIGIAVNVVGNIFKKVTAPVRHFVRALGRIAFYRLIRSILKSITQGIKEGIQNLALYSKALEGLDTHNANEVLSRYASEFLYFKNAVATAVIPVLRALIPYVETAINKMINFINVLAQVGSAIFGTEYTKAKYFWVDYADSLDNATGRAKALHHQLAGFDELNNLTANSGGSGSTKLEDAKEMFEEASIDSKIKEWVDSAMLKVQNGIAKIKEITKPFIDRVREMWGEIKTKVLPNLKRIYDNLKKIWQDFLQPILDEFLKGFFEGFTGEAFKSLPDTLEKITDKVADFTDWLVKLKEKIPIDKVEDFAFSLGELLGKITGFYKPYTWAVNAIPAIKNHFIEVKEKCDKWGESLARLLFNVIDLQDPSSVLSQKIQGLKDKANEAKEKFESLKTFAQYLYDTFINLQEPTSVLSTKISNLKDKAKDLWDKIKDLIDKVSTLKTNISNLKTYLTNNNPFANTKTNADNLLKVITDVTDVFDAIKKIGSISVDVALNLTGLENVKNNLQQIAESAGNLIPDDSPLGKVIKTVEDVVDKTKPDSPTDSTKTPKEAQYGNYGGYGSLQEYLQAQSKKKATGGFVNRGDLFIANEAGAEMVGSIGTNTAVANNNQITEAIASATYTAMSRALSENGGSVNIVVEGDGDKMFKVFQKKQREYQRATGLAY